LPAVAALVARRGRPRHGAADDARDGDALTRPEAGDAGGTAGDSDIADTAGGGSSPAADGEGDDDGGSDVEAGAGAAAEDGRDTRLVPEGGNGGATDVGVTDDTITIANVSDISGPVPGIFEDAQKAVTAFVAHFAATEGTIYGRQLELLPLDSRLDSGANRQQYLRACDEAIAAVGSMSAFEEGAADPISGCGLPDIRAIATSQPMQRLTTVHSAEVQTLGSFGTAAWNFWKEQHPTAIENAAYLFLDNETTRFQTGQNRAGAQRLGYEWEYVQAIQLAETNYNGFVIEMQDRGIEFVTFQGDDSQAARLAQAMDRQGFEPEVFALQANIYTPDFLATGGSAVEGAHIGVTSVLLEEIDQHEELQTYREWLRRVDPSAEPTGLGMFAWSSAKLLTQTLKEIGPRGHPGRHPGAPGHRHRLGRWRTAPTTGHRQPAGQRLHHHRRGLGRRLPAPRALGRRLPVRRPDRPVTR
jgi:hypothetical protein